MSSPNPVRHNSVLLVLLLMAQLLLMSGSVRGRDGVSRLESAMVVLTSPVVSLAAWTGSGVRSMFLGIRGTLLARSENLRIRRSMEELSLEAKRLRELEPENHRLRNLLFMKEAMLPDSVGASVVAASRNRDSQLIIVNRGSLAGVEEDQAVVAWGGVVGRVVSVSPGYSKVRLMTDPNSGVAAMIQHSRVDGIILGDGTATLTLNYVPADADVSKGDVVITSGLDGFFPKGVRIGEVTYVGSGGEVSRQIHVRPACGVNELEEVLILGGGNPGRLLPEHRPETDR